MWIWLFIHEDSSRGVGFSTFQKLMHEPERAHTARHRQHAAEHQCWSGMTVITHARWNSRRRGYCVQTRLSVCLFVRALTGKRLELSTPNLVHVYSIAVARHVLTQHNTVTKTARSLVTMPGILNTYTRLCYLRPLAAWICMSIRLLMFSSWRLLLGSSRQCYNSS